MSDATDPRNIEAMAAAEHESWSGWMRYMIPRLERELMSEAVTDPGKADVSARLLGAPSMKRWLRQMGTLYADLPEEEKESDRIEARKKLPIYTEDLAAERNEYKYEADMLREAIQEFRDDVQSKRIDALQGALEGLTCFHAFECRLEFGSVFPDDWCQNCKAKRALGLVEGHEGDRP